MFCKHAWAMLKRLPVNNFQWRNDKFNFNEDLIWNYGEDSEKGYILKVYTKYALELHGLHSDMPFLSDKMKISNFEKHNAVMEYIGYCIGYNVNTYSNVNTWNNEVIHRVMEFNQKALLKPYIDMNAERRTKTKNDFEKDFLKVIHNFIFEKTMENVRKHRNIRLIKINKRKH